MLKLLKWWTAKEDLQALQRYRMACCLVWRWNAQEPNSAETASWIGEVGEGKRGADIEQFREQLRSNQVLTSSRLYHAVNQMMGVLGANGEVDTRTSEVRSVMAALEELDSGAYQESRDHIDAERYRKVRNQDIQSGFPRPGIFIGRTMPDSVLTHEDADKAIDAMPTSREVIDGKA